MKKAILLGGIIGVFVCSLANIPQVVAGVLIPETRIEPVVLYEVDPVGEPLFFVDVEEMDDFMLENHFVDGFEALEFSVIHGFIEGGRNIRVESDAPIKISLHGLHYDLQQVMQRMLVNDVGETDVVFDKLTKIEIMPLEGEANVTIRLGDKFSYRVPFAPFPQFFIDGIEDLDEFFPGIAGMVLGSKSIKMIEMKSNVNGNRLLDRSMVEVDEEHMGFWINDPDAVFDRETSYLLHYEVLR